MTTTTRTVTEQLWDALSAILEEPETRISDEHRTAALAAIAAAQAVAAEPPGGTTNAEYIALAREEYQRDGEIEIDDDAVISRGDDPGAYVQAWVWVYDPKKPEFCECGRDWEDCATRDGGEEHQDR